MKKFTYNIFLVLNILVAAALLFSYLAPFINPARMVLPALFGLAYPYLLLVNLLFICLWMIRLKKTVVLSLAVVLLGWNHLNNLLPLNGRDARLPKGVDEARSFRVMSYNVRGFNRYRWNSDPNTQQALFSFLREESPEILCMQEYYSTPAVLSAQAIARELPFAPHRAVYYTSASKSMQGFGIATYSAFPILKRSRIPFNSIGNAAMYTDMEVYGDTLRIFNIHLQSIRLRDENYAFMDTARLSYSAENMEGVRSIGSRLKAAFVQRSEQADMISNYIRSSPYPVIVMGDFNDTPQSYAYRKIRKGLQDAFRKAGRGFGNTYAGELPSFRIDHIMVAPPLVPFGFRRTRNKYSDHFPISTGIFLPEAPVSE